MFWSMQVGAVLVVLWLATGMRRKSSSNVEQKSETTQSVPITAKKGLPDSIAEFGSPVWSVTDYIGSSQKALPEIPILPMVYHASALLHLDIDGRTELVKLDTRPEVTVRHIDNASLPEFWKVLYDEEKRSPNALMLFSARKTSPTQAAISLPHSMDNGLGGYHIKHLPWRSLTFGEFAEELILALGDNKWHLTKFNCQDVTETMVNVLMPMSIEYGGLTVSQNADIAAEHRRMLKSLVTKAGRIMAKSRWRADREAYGDDVQTLHAQRKFSGCCTGADLDSEGYTALDLNHAQITGLQVFWEDVGFVGGLMHHSSRVKAYGEFVQSIKASEAALKEEHGSNVPTRAMYSWTTVQNCDLPDRGVNVTTVSAEDIEAVKKLVEEKGYSGFSVKGDKAFVKKFELPLTTDDLEYQGENSSIASYFATPVPFILSDVLKKARYRE